MVDEYYNPRKHRTPLPKDDDSTQIREVAKLIADKVKEDLNRDDEPTRRMPAMSADPSGEFHVTVLSQLAALNAKMSVVEEIKATTNTLRDKQQEVLVALARGDGRMNGLDQGMGTINSRVDGVIDEIRGTNNRLDRIERGESSSIHRAIPKTESTKKPSWVSGAKALAIVIIAVGTAIAAVVTVIVKTQAPAAPVANQQEPTK